MRKLLLAGAAALCAIWAGQAVAATVVDASDDFLQSFVGTHDADLDVLKFSVDYDSGASNFLLNATLNGAVNPSLAGLYVIGVNTGTGLIHPFGPIGAPDVLFNQVIVINKDGTGGVGNNALAAGAVSIKNDTFSAIVPLSLLPSTGFDPLHYGFNLWPRNGLGNNNQIADFAPDNATLSAAPVPEPAIWMTMIMGFGVIGGALRHRRSQPAAMPSADMRIGGPQSC
jgi:hypothetical protein